MDEFQDFIKLMREKTRVDVLYLNCGTNFKKTVSFKYQVFPTKLHVVLHIVQV